MRGDIVVQGEHYRDTVELAASIGGLIAERDTLSPDSSSWRGLDGHVRLLRAAYEEATATESGGGVATSTVPLPGAETTEDQHSPPNTNGGDDERTQPLGEPFASVDNDFVLWREVAGEDRIVGELVRVEDAGFVVFVQPDQLHENPCPMCLGTGGLGFSPPEDETRIRCPGCDGWGKVYTGSRVEGQTILDCPRCNAGGWVDKPGAEPPTPQREAALVAEFPGAVWDAQRRRWQPPTDVPTPWEGAMWDAYVGKWV